MNDNKDMGKDLEVIKKILIVQLVRSGIAIRDIAKITEMSSASIYKFLPKNLGKNKEDKS